MKPLLLSLMLTTVAAVPALSQDWAIDGYDAVGLVQGGRALPGRGDIATLWQRQVWHFATEENRRR